jgi:hypothetical protein
MSDAPAGSNAPPREEAAARTDGTKTDGTPPAIKDGVAVETGDASNTEAKPEPKQLESDAVAARHDETVAVDNKPVEASPAASADTKPAQTAVAATATNDAPKAEAKSAPDVKEEKSAETRIEAVKVEAKPELAKPEQAKPEVAKAEPAQTETVKSDATPLDAKLEDKAKAAAVAADAKKDQARRLADTNKPVVAKPEAPKRTGQIAVFISRKDSKIYVRQNFAPLFEMPVTIAASDRPLGTHVFTAEADRKDTNVLHWSVVSLPMSARSLQRSANEEHVSRGRKVAAAGPIDMKPLPMPDSAAEALDRVSIPADAMARITEALTTGSSIIVSDQGINQGETGEGTDFIVSLR